MTALYAFGFLLAAAGIMAAVRRRLAARNSRQPVQLNLNRR